MDHSIAIPALVAFFITLILGPGLISFLHKLKFGQFIREEGPESHLKKSGTPTMGGILFLVGILVGSAFYIPDYKKIIPILFVTLGFGLIGFLDDYIKVVMKRNLGLTPAQKMLGQIVITAVFAFYMVNHSGLGTELFHFLEERNGILEFYIFQFYLLLYLEQLMVRTLQMVWMVSQQA